MKNDAKSHAEELVKKLGSLAAWRHAKSKVSPKSKASPEEKEHHKQMLKHIDMIRHKEHARKSLYVKEDAPANSVAGGGVPSITDATTNYAKQKGKYKKVLKRKLKIKEEFTHYVQVKYPHGGHINVKVTAKDHEDARKVAGGRIGRGAEIVDVKHKDEVK